jgi:hypothetical protein
MNEETKFKKGDIVEWAGVYGCVEISSKDCVWVNFGPIEYEGNSRYESTEFLPDGRLFDWHTEPSLKLISKAKKKRKVKLYACLIGESGNQHLSLLTLESLANTAVRVPELDKEVEVDE